jgi:hypothetical protein
VRFPLAPSNKERGKMYEFTENEQLILAAILEDAKNLTLVGEAVQKITENEVEFAKVAYNTITMLAEAIYRLQNEVDDLKKQLQSTKEVTLEAIGELSYVEDGGYRNYVSERYSEKFFPKTESK